MAMKAFVATARRPWGNSDMRSIGPVMLGCIEPEAREILDLSVDLWGKELRAQGLDPKEDRKDGAQFFSWLLRKSGLLMVPEAEWDAFEQQVIAERTKFVKGDKHLDRQTAYSMAYWFFRWSALVEVREA